MKRAEITCVSPALTVEDLGLKLIKGQVVYVEETVARGSKDLECLRRAGGVIVRFLQRCRVLRPAQPIPEAVTPPRNPLKALLPPPQRTPTAASTTPLPPPQAPPIDLDALAVKVADLLRPTLEANQMGMEQAVRKALGNIPLGTQGVAMAPVKQPEREEKIFVPDVEFSGVMRGEIPVEEGASGSGTVDEATAALRKVRAAAKKEANE